MFLSLRVNNCKQKSDRSLHEPKIQIDNPLFFQCDGKKDQNDFGGSKNFLVIGKRPNNPILARKAWVFPQFFYLVVILRDTILMSKHNVITGNALKKKDQNGFSKKQKILDTRNGLKTLPVQGKCLTISSFLYLVVILRDTFSDNEIRIRTGNQHHIGSDWWVRHSLQ